MRVLVLAALFCVAGFCAPASAHPFHHHNLRHHHLRHSKQRIAQRPGHWRRTRLRIHRRIVRTIRKAQNSFSPVSNASSSNLVKVALQYVGYRKFTRMQGNWCRDATNSWLRSAGYRTDSSRLALEAVHLGPRLRAPQPGALGVMGRRGGGHVGVIVAVWRNIVEMVSGNSSHGRVALVDYPIGRFKAFVEPVRR